MWSSKCLAARALWLQRARQFVYGLSFVERQSQATQIFRQAERRRGWGDERERGVRMWTRMWWGRWRAECLWKGCKREEVLKRRVTEPSLSLTCKNIQKSMKFTWMFCEKPASLSFVFYEEKITENTWHLVTNWKFSIPTWVLKFNPAHSHSDGFVLCGFVRLWC